MNVPNHDSDINDLGLQADLGMWTLKPFGRRKALQLGLASLGAFLVGCVQDSNGGACLGKIPKETAGPYPGDGSNGANALTKSGMVRSDIRSSLATGNTATGLPLTLEMTLVDTAQNCAPLVGYAIYAWHCTSDGNYSMYSASVSNEDFLRGVQATDANGKVVFKSIFPGCYSGRWPHVHFEVYASLAQATNANNVLQTSQLALPEAVCKSVYSGATGYGNSSRALSQITLASDNVFRDGATLQMASTTGDAINGYTASLIVGI